MSSFRDRYLERQRWTDYGISSESDGAGTLLTAATVNEMRERLGLPPVQAGDQILPEHAFTEAAVIALVHTALVPYAKPLPVNVHLDTSTPATALVIVRSHGLLLNDFRRHFPAAELARRKPVHINVIGLLLTRNDEETLHATLAAFRLGGASAVGAVVVGEEALGAGRPA